MNLYYIFDGLPRTHAALSSIDKQEGDRVLFFYVDGVYTYVRSALLSGLLLWRRYYCNPK